MQHYTEDNVYYEVMKTILVLVTAFVIKHWSLFILKKSTLKQISRQYVIGTIYFLFFVFFILNITYYVNYANNNVILQYAPIVLASLLLVTLNLLLRRFYQIGAQFKFQDIVNQQIFIFETIFTSELKSEFFKNSLLKDDFFNEKLNFLKEIYKKTYYNRLRDKLLEKLLEMTKLFLYLFAAFFFSQLNIISIFNFIRLPTEKLFFEIVILFLTFIILYLMTISRSKKKLRIRRKKRQNGQIVDEEKYHRNPQDLLFKINEIIIKIIKEKNFQSYADELDEIDRELDIVMKHSFDLLLKTYRPNMYTDLKNNKLKGSFESPFYNLTSSVLFKRERANKLNKNDFKFLIMNKSQSVSSGTYSLNGTEMDQNDIDAIKPFSSSNLSNQIKPQPRLTDMHEFDKNIIDNNDIYYMRKESDKFSDQELHKELSSPMMRDTLPLFLKHASQELDAEVLSNNQMKFSIPNLPNIAKFKSDRSEEPRFTNISQQQRITGTRLQEITDILAQEPKLLYESSKLFLKVQPFIRLKLNASLDTKLKYLPMNNHKVLLSILCFSLFDIFKNVILNLLLLTVTKNVNFMSMISVTAFVGVGLMTKIKFPQILMVISISFWVRLFSRFHIIIFGDSFIAMFLRLKDDSKTDFIFEMTIIAFTLFLLIPAVLLIKIVFEDFQKIEKPIIRDSKAITNMTFSSLDRSNYESGDKSNAFEIKKIGNSKLMIIDYFKWNSLGYKIMPKIHELLITKEKFIYPIICIILACTDTSYIVYIEIYFLYDLLYLIVLKSSSMETEYLTKMLHQGLFSLKSGIFLYFIVSIFCAIIGVDFLLNRKLVIIFVILNFKIILNDSRFMNFNRNKVKQNFALKKELRSFLHNLEKNEVFIMDKIIGEINYQNFISFTKFNSYYQVFSCQNLIRSNLLIFHYVFSSTKSFLQKLFVNQFFHFFESSHKLWLEDPILLLLVLKEKYQHIINVDYSMLDILSNNYSSAVEAIKTINNYRNAIHRKERKVVKQFNVKMLNDLKAFHAKPEAEKILNRVFQLEEALTQSKFGVPNNEIEKSFTTKRTKEIPNFFASIDFQQLEQVNTYSEFSYKLKEMLSEVLIFQPSFENFMPSVFESKISSKNEIRLTNFKYMHIIDKGGVPNLSLRSFIFVIFGFAAYHFERILIVPIIFLLILNCGFIMVFFVSFLIYLVCIEQQSVYRSSKMLMFYCLFIGFNFSKNVINYLEIDKSATTKLTFIIGPLEQGYLDIITMALIFLLMHVCRSKISTRYFPKQEFFGESCYRVF